MSQTIIVSVTCADRPGLISTLTQCLFDLGANLGDSAFSTLGRAARFSAICDIPKDVSTDEVKTALSSLDVTEGGEISVSTFTFPSEQGEAGKITHAIYVGGGDRPGLVTRLAEVFQQYEANIINMNCARSGMGSDASYAVEISAFIPEKQQQNCLNTVANTAGELGLQCRIQAL